MYLFKNQMKEFKKLLKRNGFLKVKDEEFITYYNEKYVYSFHLNTFELTWSFMETDEIGVFVDDYEYSVKELDVLKYILTQESICLMYDSCDKNGRIIIK